MGNALTGRVFIDKLLMDAHGHGAHRLGAVGQDVYRQGVHVQGAHRHRA